MAENIYSKGTRVWFEDKDQAWISAEVVSVSKGADDSFKLFFIDERGKVRIFSRDALILSPIFDHPGNYDHHNRKKNQGWQGGPSTTTESPST
jgi:hypothetical protein